MSDLDTIILEKLSSVETDVSQIKVDVAKNTESLDHHIKRTDGLQFIVEDLSKIVEPLHNDYIAKRAIEDYKKNRRDELVYKLKLPGYILAAITLAGTVLAWLVHK